MPNAAGSSLSAVRQIERCYGLLPHRIRQIKLVRDPPAHTIVLSADEKSELQALDRIQPGGLMKKG